MEDLKAIPKSEYRELLLLKKEKLEEQLLEVNAVLESLEGVSPKPTLLVGSSSDLAIDTNTSKKRVGWKYVIDEILEKANSRYLSAREIIHIACRGITSPSERESARKSISSALSSNTKPGKMRYLYKIERGFRVFTINPDFSAKEDFDDNLPF